jgi:hypothetical protein
MPKLKMRCKVNPRVLDTSRFNAAIQRSNEAGAKLYESYVRKIIKDVLGRQYATLAELRAMGHPYARNPAVTVNRRGVTPQRFAPPMPTGYVSTHPSSYAASKFGNFYDSIEWGIESRGARTTIEVWGAEQDLARILLTGTPTMVPRPYKSLIGSRIRDEVTNHVSNYWRQRIKFEFVAAGAWNGPRG